MSLSSLFLKKNVYYLNSGVHSANLIITFVSCRILFDELMVKEERKSSEQHELYSSFILFLSEKNSKNTLMQNDFSGTISQMDGSRRNFLQLNHKPWDKLFF